MTRAQEAELILRRLVEYEDSLRAYNQGSPGSPFLAVWGIGVLCGAWK